MAGFVQIPTSVLLQVTDPAHERNMYAHPNPIARAIFWQRLSVGFHMLARHADPAARVLDFGGGSGAFLPALAQRFADLSIVDLDLDDARRIATHFRLDRVQLHQQDITRWDPGAPFDVAVAMDVLEHFPDKAVPQRFFERHLRGGGLLLVSLPTENLLYRLGRIVVRKTKPADHYHSSDELMRHYQAAGYTVVEKRFAPRLGPLAVPLFQLAVLRKPAA
jgi:2-polyprenyl-3-methyl-5-hydroxy-6-metoxy-1,4-benzoquinol methylase